MSATKQATPASILPQVTITYRKEGEHFHFDVTKEGVTRKLTYHDPSKGWTCDCEQFADDTCLHVELVKLWRAQQKNGSNGTHAANGANGTSGPTPPRLPATATPHRCKLKAHHSPLLVQRIEIPANA